MSLDNLSYEAYHIHSHYSNPVITDSVVGKADYIPRLKEIGAEMLSSCEHGTQGNLYECNDLAENERKGGYELRPLAVAEAYYVEDRSSKDKTNAHLILAAVNDEGRKELNYAMSMANMTGFYYRPRLDMELLLDINPTNMIITTACVAGIWQYQDHRDIIKRLYGHFGENFYLEVQYHNTDRQKELNEKILHLSQATGIPLIMGTDSHYVNAGDAIERNERLQSNKIIYPDEEGWYMHLPRTEEVVHYFREQNILSDSDIEKAIRNTHVFRYCKNLSFGTAYNLDRKNKIPNIHHELTQEQRNDLYVSYVVDGYNKLYADASPERRKADMSEIQYELNAVIDTGMADYFIDIHDIMKKAISEKGGVLTQSGRGSATSFVTNHLLGMTSVNRLYSQVQMYPDRFISKERMEAGTLPDYDSNVANQDPFVEAAKDILGEHSIYIMSAFGTLKTLSAWKMYAKAYAIPFEVSNAVSESLTRYEKAVRYAEDENDLPELSSYVDKDYLSLVEESAKYRGIIDSISPHPCAFLIYDGDIRREIGVVRTKSKDEEPRYAAYIDGETASKYGYLKIDFLKVDVVRIIHDAFRALGRNVPPVDELLKLTENDKATWEMYAKGYTMGLNQVEKQASTRRIMFYKPRNISELSAFVAAIRPGFKTMLNTFLSRQRFEYGIPALDKLIQTPEMPYSYILYQEHVMKVLQAAGISAADSYTCIKAISKKNLEKIMSFKEIFLEGFAQYLEKNTTDNKDHSSEANKVWQIIEDSSQYSFNASHAYCVALDSLYGAYLKAHYPLVFYMTLLRVYSEKGDKKRISLVKNEMLDAFGIKVKPFVFGRSGVEYHADEKEMVIYDSLMSAKYIGRPTAEALSELGKEEHPSFIDLLVRIDQTPGINKKQITILINLGYFSSFGSKEKLLTLFEEFNSGKNRYNKGLKPKTAEKRLEVLRVMENQIEDPQEETCDLREVCQQVSFEVEYLGIPVTTYPDCRMTYAVTDVNDKGSVYLSLVNVSTGKTGEMRVKKSGYSSRGVKVGDVLEVTEWRKKPKYVFENNKMVPSPEGSEELWLEDYEVVRID